MKQAKERMIFNNYDLDDDFDYVKENPEEFFDGDFLDDDFPTDNAIWDMVYDNSNDLWDIEEMRLEEFFDNNDSSYIVFGSVGRWDGRYEGGEIFSSWYDLVYNVCPWKDCDYVKLYDVNGHFYIQCSHHDGTNCFEIRELTKRGKDYFENWKYSYDERSEKEVFENLINDSHYSRLPRYMEKVYGCPAREYA